MNLVKLFEMQKVLDERIEKEHPRQEGEDRLAKKILALQVELGELANEWRGFKFWSKDQEPRTVIYENINLKKVKTNPLLEEYVDCLHFILSIGNELLINIGGLERFSIFDTYEHRTEEFIFGKLFQDVSNMYGQDEDETLADYYRSFQWMLELGHKLGFTWEEIKQAYISKNEVNHERQANNY